MSDCFINIRIAWFHIQAERGSLWSWRVSANNYWRTEKNWLREPIAVYEFNLQDGWAHRNAGVSRPCNHNNNNT